MTEQPSKPAREAGSLSLGFSRRSRPLRRLINRLATHHGQQHFCLAGLVARNFEKILRDNDKVSQFAGLKRTFELVAPARISRAQCVRSYRVLQADALLRDEASSGSAFLSLAGKRILYAFPRIQRDYRPVATECQLAAARLDTVPDPGARGTFRADVSRPDV